MPKSLASTIKVHPLRPVQVPFKREDTAIRFAEWLAASPHANKIKWMGAFKQNKTVTVAFA